MKKALAISLISGLLMASPLVAEEAARKTMTDGAPPEMTAEMMQVIQPGEAHKKLQTFVGKWDYTVKWWMEPNSKPQQMKGASLNALIMDGRFLQQSAVGESVENQPRFQGMGLTGYDNLRQEYTSVWVDNMGTGMMTATAAFDEKRRTFDEKGSFSCPMTGEKQRAFHAKWKIINDNRYTYEMFTTDKGGKQFKSMEIAYKRVK